MEKLFLGIELAEETIPNWFVVAMGIGTVFVGLVAIVIICKIIGVFFVNGDQKETPNPVETAKPQTEQVIENRQEIIAAVSAVLAEELGTDVSALRIHSFKKL